MLNQEVPKTLAQSTLNKILSQEEMGLLFSQNKLVQFNAGDTILKQGTKSNGIYIIIEGTVTATAKTLRDVTTKLNTYNPGSFLGEISFIENGPCATSIITNDIVKCLFISREFMELLAVFYQELKYKLYNAIAKQVCERLKTMHDKIIVAIGNVDMTTQSFFGEIIESLTTPTEISFQDAKIDILTIHKLPNYAHFSQDEVKELFNHGKLIKAPKHCTLIHKGETNASCYIVLFGAVQSSIVHDKKIAKLSVIGPVTLFSSIPCINEDANFTITFSTCEPAILFKCTKEDLEYFQQQQPKLWFKIFDLICKSLVALEKSIDKLDIRLNIEKYNR